VQLELLIRTGLVLRQQAYIPCAGSPAVTTVSTRLLVRPPDVRRLRQRPYQSRL